MRGCVLCCVCATAGKGVLQRAHGAHICVTPPYCNYRYPSFHTRHHTSRKPPSIMQMLHAPINLKSHTYMHTYIHAPTQPTQQALPPPQCTLQAAAPSCTLCTMASFCICCVAFSTSPSSLLMFLLQPLRTSSGCCGLPITTTPAGLSILADTALATTSSDSCFSACEHTNTQTDRQAGTHKQIGTQAAAVSAARER